MYLSFFLCWHGHSQWAGSEAAGEGCVLP